MITNVIADLLSKTYIPDLSKELPIKAKEFLKLYFEDRLIISSLISLNIYGDPKYNLTNVYEDLNQCNYESKIPAEISDMILTNIANHYGITKQEAFNEITSPNAENLLDYITGPRRSAVRVLMKNIDMNMAADHAINSDLSK